MPNEHGQVTRDDFKAPEGQHRIIQEEMSDGQLDIVADIKKREFALLALATFREAKPRDFFTLCDDEGPLDT